MAARLDIESILREVGAAQHGVVTRARLPGRGIAVHAIARMCPFRSVTMFASTRPVIAMIHVGALPGTPAGGASLRDLEARAGLGVRDQRRAGRR